MTLEWQPSFKRHVNRNEELFVSKFFVLVNFFSVDFLFLSILISFSYNFRALEVISKKSQNGESVMAVIRTNGLI